MLPTRSGSTIFSRSRDSYPGQSYNTDLLSWVTEPHTIPFKEIRLDLDSPSSCQPCSLVFLLSSQSSYPSSWQIRMCESCQVGVILRLLGKSGILLNVSRQHNQHTKLVDFALFTRSHGDNARWMIGCPGRKLILHARLLNERQASFLILTYDWTTYVFPWRKRFIYLTIFPLAARYILECDTDVLILTIIHLLATNTQIKKSHRSSGLYPLSSPLGHAAEKNGRRTSRRQLRPERKKEANRSLDCLCLFERSPTRYSMCRR